MRKLQLIALTIFLLVLSMPIVHAQELNILRISGKAGVDGVSKSQDELTIEVNARLPQEEIIDTEQVRLFVEDSFFFFDNCTKLQNSSSFRCIVQDPEFSAFEDVNFNIKLFTDDEKEVLSRGATLKIDSLPPRIVNFSAGPEITKEAVQVEYRLEEYGLELGVLQGCSGIKDIKITQFDEVLFTETGKKDLCHKEDEITLLLKKSGPLCMVVTDFAGFESIPKCTKEIKVDTSPPVISELSITDSRGLSITHVKSGIDNVANVQIEASDDGKLESVTANLDSISKDALGFTPPSLVNGNIHIWNNVVLKEPANCVVKVEAKDSLGNTATKDFNCDIRPDNTAPIIKDLAPDKRRGNVPLYGRSGTVIAEIEDKDDKGQEGSGLDSRNVYVNLQSLGAPGELRTDGCVQTGASWKCSWTIGFPNSTTEGNYSISITAADDLENTADSKSFDIVYDGTPPATPIVVNRSVLKGEEGQKYRGAVLTDFLQYTVRSKGFTNAVADFSEFGGSKESPAKFCVKPNGEPGDCLVEDCDCFFEGQVELSGPYEASTYFVFSDDADNTAGTSAMEEVFGIDNATRPRYWNPVVTCTPNLIDRSTASKINPYIACRVHLNSSVQNIEPISIKGPASPTDCSGPVDLNLNDIYMTNNFEGSKDPYLFLKLEAKDYRMNSLNFSCPVSIITKRIVRTQNRNQTFVTPKAQVINASVRLQFYNEPMRDIHSNIDKQIEKAMKDSFANMEWIGTLRKFLHYGETICQIKGVITNIINVVFTVTTVLGITKDALNYGTVTKPAGEAVGQAYLVACETGEITQETYKTVNDVLDAICSFLNCQQAQGGKSGPGFGTQGVPWCQKIEELLKFVPGLGMGVDMAGMSALSVKDSLIWSVICVCIPGIVYNLEKLRQIQCFKSVCLHDNVKEEGYPVSFCNEMYGFMMCQFIVGQIFAAIPFTQFFNKLTDFVVNLISDPAAVFTLAIGATCELMCLFSLESTSGIYVVCAIFKVVAMAAEAVASIVKMTKTKGYFSNVPGDQYCKRMEKIKKEYKEREKDQSSGSGTNSSTTN